MNRPGRKIYEDESLEVLFLDGEADTSLVTFTPWASAPPTYPFALTYCQKQNVPAACFVSKHNHWWQDGNMAQAIAAANAHIPTNRRVAYGSSMGAFAAISFGARLGCDTVVAISPQVSISREVVPWETRWKRESSERTAPVPNAANHLQNDQKLHLVYDPFVTLDRKHAELVETIALSRGATVINHKFAFSGHQTLRTLMQANLLPCLLDHAAFSRAPRLALADYRRARWMSHYSAQEVLANPYLLKKHPRLLNRVAERYRARGITNARIEYLTARILLSLGEHERAKRLLSDIAAPDAKTSVAIKRLMEKVSDLRSR